MSNDQLTTSPADSAASRTDRIAALLDKAIDNAAAALEDGTISSSLLKEIVALAKTAGVEIAEGGEPMSAAASRLVGFIAPDAVLPGGQKLGPKAQQSLAENPGMDPIMASLADVDPELFQ